MKLQRESFSKRLDELTKEPSNENCQGTPSDRTPARSKGLQRCFSLGYCTGVEYSHWAAEGLSLGLGV